jgi:hypothetical protein
VKAHRFILWVAAVCLLLPVETSARKKGYRLKVAGTTASSNTYGITITEDGDTTMEMIPGSFIVTRNNKEVNKGYRLNDIIFRGFDKTQNNSKESFFITNKTDRTLTGIALYIDYRTPDGRQLHKRFIRLRCKIPAGETRKVDIKSWDTQHSFYYIKSVRSKKQKGNPFYVVFNPIAYYLSK